jgi:hypothetical protein
VDKGLDEIREILEKSENQQELLETLSPAERAVAEAAIET